MYAVPLNEQYLSRSPTSCIVFVVHSVCILRKRLHQVASLYYTRLHNMLNSSPRSSIHGYVPAHRTNKMSCVPSKDSVQPVRPPRLISLRCEESLVLSYSLSLRLRFLSNLTDAQADLTLRWSHKSYCRFCRALALMHNAGFQAGPTFPTIPTFPYFFVFLLFPTFF